MRLKCGGEVFANRGEAASLSQASFTRAVGLSVTLPSPRFTVDARRRSSGTTPLRAHAGFNEVEMVIDYLLNGQAIQQPTVKPMVILRHLSETVVMPEAIKQMELQPGSYGTRHVS
jgi:hypothetical protein